MKNTTRTWNKMEKILCIIVPAICFAMMLYVVNVLIQDLDCSENKKSLYRLLFIIGLLPVTYTTSLALFCNFWYVF